MPLDNWTEGLASRAQTGDSQAIGELVQLFLHPAYTLALAIVGRVADAEDVAQEGLIMAISKIHTCENPAKFRGWALQIVRNHAKNYLRRRKLRDVSPDSSPPEQYSQGPSPEQAPLRGQLLAALDKLGAIPREVVLLHDLEGWTHSQVAEALDMSVLMSRQHLFHARKQLRVLLSDNSTPLGARA